MLEEVLGVLCVIGTQILSSTFAECTEDDSVWHGRYPIKQTMSLFEEQVHETETERQREK